MVIRTVLVVVVGLLCSCASTGPKGGKADRAFTYQDQWGLDSVRVRFEQPGRKVTMQGDALVSPSASHLTFLEAYYTKAVVQADRYLTSSTDRDRDRAIVVPFLLPGTLEVRYTVNRGSFCIVAVDSSGRELANSMTYGGLYFEDGLVYCGRAVDEPTRQYMVRGHSVDISAADRQAGVVSQTALQTVTTGPGNSGDEVQSAAGGGSSTAYFYLRCDDDIRSRIAGVALRRVREEEVDMHGVVKRLQLE